MKQAIIDNTTLNYLARLEELRGGKRRASFEIINRLRLLLQVIHVPTTVKNEFASIKDLTPHKERLRSAIELEQIGFRNCTRFDSIVLTMLRDSEGIDAGEAEAIAQSYDIGVRFFITDDIDCVKSIGRIRPELRCLDTLVVLAALDLHEYLPDRLEILRLFFTAVRPVSKQTVPSLLRRAYKDAGSLYGFDLGKKELSKKTSAKTIFGHDR